MNKSRKHALSGRSIALIVAAILFISGTMLVRTLDTNFGNVDVRHICYVDVQTGITYNALLFIPKTATSDTPAPIVVTQHGGSQTLTQMSALNIELSRRGYVVLSYDNFGAGQSEPGGTRESATDSAIAYLQTLSFVLPDQIVMSGHSMGGTSSGTAAMRHADCVKLCLALGMNTREEVLHTNYAYVLGSHDASALARTKGNVRHIVDTESYRTLFGTDEDIVVGKEYGNWANGTGRIYMVSNTGHTWEPFDMLTIEYCLDVINRVIPNPNYIAPTSQIWMLQLLGMGLVLASLFVFLFAIAAVFLKTKFFGKLILPVRKPVGFTPKTTPWYIAFAILIIVPAALYGACSSIMETNKIAWMKMNSTVNGIVVWHWITCVVYIVLFAVFHVVQGKKAGGNLMTYGLSTQEEFNAVGIGYILRSLLLAVCTLGSTYALFLVYYEFTGESICFVKWCFNKIPTFNIGTFLLYSLLELPFPIMVGLCNRSISVNNGYRKDGKGMRSSIIVSLFVSSSGLVIFLMVFLANILLTGGILFNANRGYIFFTGLSGTLLYIGMCGLVNCFITNKTNSIYAGTFAAAMLSALSLVGNFPMG